MVPGFLLADTNPKAAGIFCLLLLLASHPCRALRFTHWLSQWNTRIQTSTDEHMMDYKYSGQDWRYVQRNVRWGHNTHCAHFNPTTRSPSALFCRKKNLHICSSDAVHLGRLVHECAPWSPDSSVPFAVFLFARTALIRCVSCCMTSQASGIVCLFMFVSVGERCSLGKHM